MHVLTWAHNIVEASL